MFKFDYVTVNKDNIKEWRFDEDNRLLNAQRVSKVVRYNGHDTLGHIVDSQLQSENFKGAELGIQTTLEPSVDTTNFSNESVTFSLDLFDWNTDYTIQFINESHFIFPEATYIVHTTLDNAEEVLSHLPNTIEIVQWNFAFHQRPNQNELMRLARLSSLTLPGTVVSVASAQVDSVINDIMPALRALKENNRQLLISFLPSDTSTVCKTVSLPLDGHMHASDLLAVWIDGPLKRNVASTASMIPYMELFLKDLAEDVKILDNTSEAIFDLFLSSMNNVYENTLYRVESLTMPPKTPRRVFEYKDSEKPKGKITVSKKSISLGDKFINTLIIC